MNRVVVGQVGNIDTDARTLALVTDEGNELVLSYTEDAEVQGSAAGVQGLIGVPETRVSVHYRESASAPGAVPSREVMRIEIMP